MSEYIMTALSTGDRMKNFIRGVFLATLGIRNELSAVTPNFQSSNCSYLSCGTCCGVLVEPVCQPCGHSLCKSCAERLIRRVVWCPAACPKEHNLFVDKQVSRNHNVTLVLSNLLEHWFPHKMEVHWLKEEGNKLAAEGKFQLAIKKYSEALTTGKVDDHRVLSNRSKAFVAVGNYSEALKDAERCCVLQPFWPKGHYRRAVVLEKLGKLGESLAAYMLCMRFGGSDCTMQKVTAALFIQLLEQKLQYVAHNSNDANSLNAIDKKSQNSCFQELRELILKLSIQSHKYYTSALHNKSQLSVDAEVNEADLECLLCKSLLFEPVTTSCGHTFCRECLYRVLDHAHSCPVCRAILVTTSGSYEAGLVINVALEGILEHHFKAQTEKRREQLQQAKLETQQIGLSTEVELPLFICTHTYPAVTYTFHVFEPCYRMLIRNCMKGSRRFGMCAKSNDAKFSKYGTVLYIESVQYTPDGKSVIKTKGERRFEILDIRMCDGLHVAKIDFISDKLLSNAEAVKRFENEVYQLAKAWFIALSNPIKLYIINAVGTDILTVNPTSSSSPTDGPLWLWIFIHVLPTSNECKTSYLNSTNVLERLKTFSSSIPAPALLPTGHPFFNVQQVI